MSENPPWERRKGESRQAFEAFALYRDQGVTRSTARVAQQSGKHKSLMDRWSSRWQWGARTREYDAHRDRQLRAELHEKEVATRLRHVKIGDLALSKAVERLQALDLDHDRLPATALAHLLRAASDMQRAALTVEEKQVADPAAQAILIAIDRTLGARHE